MGVPIYYNNEFIAMVGIANKPEGFSEKLLDDYQIIFEAIGEMINSARLNVQIEEQRRYYGL